MFVCTEHFFIIVVGGYLLMTNNRTETAYEFVKQVENDLGSLGLNESQISLDVEMYSEENTVTLDYEIETMGWVEECLDRESVSHKGSYSSTFEEGLVPDREQVRKLLDDNFLESAIRLDNEVIRESLSPDYDAF